MASLAPALAQISLSKKIVHEDLIQIMPVQYSAIVDCADEWLNIFSSTFLVRILYKACLSGSRFSFKYLPCYQISK